MQRDCRGYHFFGGMLLALWHAVCMELARALHAWQSWVPQNPRFILPHCPQGVAHLRRAKELAALVSRAVLGPLKEWILPNWETVSARLQTHSKVQWNVIQHTAACGGNQRSFPPSGSSGTFDVTNQDLMGWSSRIQTTKGLWFLSVYVCSPLVIN